MCKPSKPDEAEIEAWVDKVLGTRGGGGKDAKGKPVVLEDLKMTRMEHYFLPPMPLRETLVNMLVDKRDDHILFCLFNIMTTMVPAAFLIVFVLPQSHLYGAAWFVTFFILYLQRFILALHYSTHKRLFKPTPLGNVLNRVAPLFLCPLLGIPSGVYWLHHCVMHHTDNNAWNRDLSATEGYQRDSILHFLCYWARFAVGGWFELPYYAFKQKRYLMTVGCLAGMAATWGSFLLLGHYKPVAAFWVLGLPFIFTSSALMFGNWSQHMFVCPEDPRCNYKLAYTVINHLDNMRSFNDGFHCIHHACSQTHWSEMPTKFLKTLDVHAEKDSLVFDGIGFFDVGLNVFLGRLDFLADRYVNIGQKKRTKEEVVQLLKDRLKPIKDSKVKELKAH